VLGADARAVARDGGGAGRVRVEGVCMKRPCVGSGCGARIVPLDHEAECRLKLGAPRARVGAVCREPARQRGEHRDEDRRRESQVGIGSAEGRHGLGKVAQGRGRGRLRRAFAAFVGRIDRSTVVFRPVQDEKTATSATPARAGGDSPRRPVELEARAVTVDYPGVRALDAVSIVFRGGEIHAVVGENGAGKSTLMKVLSGSVAPTDGEVRLDGREAWFDRPAAALAQGIAMVHQELSLVPTLDVAENVTLGREPCRALGLRVDRAAQRARAREALAFLGADIDLAREAGSLSIAEGQFVEIAKCLASDARLLIFDEPTAVLGEREASRLLERMRALRDEGRAVVFISHHLDEVVAVADRVSVLRDGALVATFVRADGLLRDAAGAPVDEDALAAAMVGRTLGSIYPAKGFAQDSPPILELRGFGAVGRTSGIDLAVRPGEIVGLAGLVGAGRTETAEAIVGLRPSEGLLLIDGAARAFTGAKDALAAGIAYVSEDRKGRGLHVSLSSIANMTLPTLDRHARAGGAWVDEAGERSVARRWIEAFAIRCARPAAPISSLSGGNQQKFALARWLEAAPRVLIVDEPTRGVDVGAKAEIYRIIADLAAKGLACVVISSELPELVGLAHRAVVLHQGRVAGEVDRAGLAADDREERIVRLASGLAAEKSHEG
jgi:ribose transport system ATP-binding protein